MWAAIGGQLAEISKSRLAVAESLGLAESTRVSVLRWRKS
jgi:hypothetical protein